MSVSVLPPVSDLEAILNLLSTPFWNTFDFWIYLAIGIGSLFFSIRAFLEARSAKRAAIDAGRIVKIGTITIELTEISQKLDKLQPEIHFNEARDLLTESSRRLRRLIAPFQKESDLKDNIDELKAALDAAKDSLNSVRPSNREREAPYVVYHGVEGDFATINNIVADLLGLFEKKTIKFGDNKDNY